MPRTPSNAEYYSARFNPDTSQEDKDVLDIIHAKEEANFNFKQIVSDAILRADGKTPEMYSRPQLTADLIKVYMEAVLPQFAQEIISHIKRGGISVNADESEGQTTSFANTFAKSFLERQRRAMGDE